jgi:hypothetical protein
MDLLPSMEQTYRYSCDLESRLEEQSREVSFHVTEAARPYVLQVHDKFRNADVSLVERLGEANWQRFIRVRQQLAHGDQDADKQEAGPETHSRFTPASKFHDSGLGSSLPGKTSFAPTVASHSSFISGLSAKEGSYVRVPPTPNEVAEGLPFECFLCKQTLSKVRNRIDWK